MPNALDVASYFLTVQTPENDITNLKLQKMCSYAQALSLALLGRPIFEEELEAWTHGPVVPSLYREFEAYGNCPISPQGLSEKYARELFDDEMKFILELTNSYYGDITAWGLRQRSHRDFPGEFGSKRVIPKSAIRRAFEDDPLVVKMKKVPSVQFDPQKDAVMSEREFWDALGV